MSSTDSDDRATSSQPKPSPRCFAYQVTDHANRVGRAQGAARAHARPAARGRGVEHRLAAGSDTWAGNLGCSRTRRVRESTRRCHPRCRAGHHRVAPFACHVGAKVQIRARCVENLRRPTTRGGCGRASSDVLGEKTLVVRCRWRFWMKGSSSLLVVESWHRQRRVAPPRSVHRAPATPPSVISRLIIRSAQ